MSLENISKPRLWFYRLFALLVIPLLFLACLECGLRLLGVGHSYDYTNIATNNGQAYYYHNTRFVEQFFPKQIARHPFFFSYPVQKSDSTFRIFILGASAAQGDPEHTYGFSRILKVMLREKFPTINFEVINTSITATNSHVVLPIAKEVSHHQPDLAVIYLGNNEVVGPFGSGNSFSKMSPNRTLIRAAIELRTTRIGQQINKLVGMVVRNKSPQTWQGMEMFLGSQFRADSAELKTVYSHYQDNLYEIIDAFRDKQTPVILSTVGSNLKDSPPFASQHRPGLAAEEAELWDTTYQQGIAEFQAGEYTRALSAFHRAEQIDDSFSDLQFRLGQSYLESGLSAMARKHFEQARDFDTLRFRADSSINQIIRTVAKGYTGSGFSLLEATDFFNQYSPLNIPGKELFFEHVHLNFHGNYILARQVAEQVVQFLPEGQLSGQSKPDFISEQDCSRLLALSEFDRLRIEKEVLRRLGRPPFTNQLGHAELLVNLEENYASAEKTLTGQKIDANDLLYRQALQEGKDDPWLHYNYGIFLKERKHLTAAINQFQKFLSLFPKSYKGHHELAVLLANSNRFEGSLPHYQNAIQLVENKPTRTELRFLYAYALARLENYAGSMETYEEALAEDQGSAVKIYHAMAKLKIKTGPLTEARVLLENAIAHNDDKQDIADIYFNYGHVLNRLKEKEASISAYKMAILKYEKELLSAEEKDKENLLVVIGRGYFETGNTEKGSSYLQRAINADPSALDYHLTLITSLARTGLLADALKFTEKASKIMSESGRADAVAKLKAIKLQLDNN